MIKSFVGILLTTAILTGCGSASSTTETTDIKETVAVSSEADGAPVSQDTEGNLHYPVSVETYSVSSDGATWTPVVTSYEGGYERIMANNQGTATLMIRLGLADRIAGVAAVFGPAPADVSEEFAKIPVVAEGYASKEALLGVNPDFVAGRGDLFVDGDYGIGTVDDLNDMGIASYITHVGENNADFESFLADIDNLGKIFDVEDKAGELKDFYIELTNSLKSDERYAGKTMKMAEISWIEDGMPVFGSAASETIQNEAFSMIGLDNINGYCEGDQVSIETVIAENPEIIVLFDYEGGPDMDEMIASLYENEALSDINAIKNKKVIALDFNAIYGGSGDLYSSMKELADMVYGE
ncbi:MAG: ABC transporter substrate-binding protein [Lachnospiraceae bacterium]|nr:ABC transporter substrate-binding protein [Lachnospiraceae bacterium]